MIRHDPKILGFRIFTLFYDLKGFYFERKPVVK